MMDHLEREHRVTAAWVVMWARLVVATRPPRVPKGGNPDEVEFRGLLPGPSSSPRLRLSVIAGRGTCSVRLAYAGLTANCICDVLGDTNFPAKPPAPIVAAELARWSTILADPASARDATEARTMRDALADLLVGVAAAYDPNWSRVSVVGTRDDGLKIVLLLPDACEEFTIGGREDHCGTMSPELVDRIMAVTGYGPHVCGDQRYDPNAGIWVAIDLLPVFEVANPGVVAVMRALRRLPARAALLPPV